MYRTEGLTKESVANLRSRHRGETLLFGGILSRSQPSRPVFIYGEPSGRKGLGVIRDMSAMKFLVR